MDNQKKESEKPTKRINEGNEKNVSEPGTPKGKMSEQKFKSSKRMTPEPKDLIIILSDRKSESNRKVELSMCF